MRQPRMDQEGSPELGNPTPKPVCVGKGQALGHTQVGFPQPHCPFLQSGLLGSPSREGNMLPVGKAVPDEKGWKERARQAE